MKDRDSKRKVFKKKVIGDQTCTRLPLITEWEESVIISVEYFNVGDSEGKRKHIYVVS